MRASTSLNTPLFGACWDTGHAHVAHIDQRAGILALGRRLKALHVQDGDGISDTHTAPYYGAIDWEKSCARSRTRIIAEI